MQRQFIFIVIFLFAVSQGVAQVAPKYSNEFLNIGVGARALGMSNSAVATVSGVTAGYWNPAGLTQMELPVEVGLMHAEYFAGISKYDYAGGAYRPDTSSAMAFSIVRMGVDDIQNTLNVFDSNGNIDYNRIENFSVADYSFIFSYARKTKIAGLRIGGNAKVIYRNVGKFANAWGFGLDAGLQYQAGKWQMGAMARDITSTFNVWSFDEVALNPTVMDTIINEVPDNSLEITLPKLVIGVGRNFQFNEKMSMLAEINADVTFDGKRNVLVKGEPISIDPKIGFELNYNDFIFFRFGAGNMQEVDDFEYVESEDGVAVNQTKTSWVVQPNLGLGIKFRNISIDYALTDVGSQVVSYSNIFSLHYSFRGK